MISGSAKGVLQTILAFWIFGNPVTALFVLGATIQTVASLAYSYFKSKENAAAALAAQKTVTKKQN